MIKHIWYIGTLNKDIHIIYTHRIHQIHWLDWLSNKKAPVVPTVRPLNIFTSAHHTTHI